MGKALNLNQSSPEYERVASSSTRSAFFNTTSFPVASLIALIMSFRNDLNAFPCVKR